MNQPSPLRPSGIFNARRALPPEEEPTESPSERTARLVALPLALLLGVLFARSGLGHALQRIFFGMVLHECGHALTAVLQGFPAFPLLWFTPVAEQRSTLLVLLLLGGGIGLVWLGWRAERRGWVVGGASLVVAVVVGLLLSDRTGRVLIIFGGDAGALVLGAALMATFFVPEDSVFRRGGLRWGLLVIGAAGFCDAASTWFAARRDPGEIPFGRMEGVGLSDPSVLVETYGWSERALVSRYVSLAGLCLVALGVLWLWRGVRPWLAARRSA